MKRNHTLRHLNPSAQKELFRQIAFHEAGHAVAIYLRNKQQQLPPVFFQITLFTSNSLSYKENYPAKVEGGRLIEHLPPSIEYLPKADQQAYIAAFEADIINLLIGPLAEAKYVALRDDEAINPQLVDLHALSAYGGDSDLIIVNDYIQCFVNDMQQRQEKIEQLFLEAYRFIDNRHYWKIIKALATHIIQSNKNTIPCEEIINVIESALSKLAAPRLAINYA